MAKFRFQLLESLLLLIIMATSCFRPHLCCPWEQKEALLQFKSMLIGNNSLNRQELQELESWNDTSDCCRWEGITCGNKLPQQVTDLSLSGIVPRLGLKFPVASTDLIPLFYLRTLVWLDLSENGIVGEIPHEIANLTHLSFLYLDRNEFCGAIPSSLGHLNVLQYLMLDRNYLSEEIPIEIGNLSMLEVLSLYDNHLVGEIPSFLKQMEMLKILYLDNNSLYGGIPTWLFDLRNLTNLDLGANKLSWKSDRVPTCKLLLLSLASCSVSGPIPIWLSNQTDLEDLILDDNFLTGTLPDWIAQMNFIVLRLSSNMLSGSLPASLFESPSLFWLDLSNNNFSGQLPDNIDRATSLLVLRLSGNSFCGSVPKSIFNSSSLKFLIMSRNNLVSLEIPYPPNPNQSLLSIDLSFNKLSGQLPVNFPPSLEELVLSQNRFSACTLSIGYANLSRLVYLDLHGNNFQGQFPTFVFQLSSLQFLILRSNNFEGPIPTGLTNLTRLQLLDLSFNNLSGELPPNIGNLVGMSNDPSISNIGNYFNLPSITLPDELSNHMEVFWKKAEQWLPKTSIELYTLLDLSSNQLSGHIPNSLGKLKYLKSLNLSHNKLSGQIPISFGDLESLESLDLSYNNLSGKIPETFSKFRQLDDLYLSNNKLKGCIPDGPQMDRLNDPNSYANNSGLCGMQIRIPCKENLERVPIGRMDEEKWFSWVMAAIGFAFGFLTTVLSLFVGGYFNAVPQGRHRRC